MKNKTSAIYLWTLALLAAASAAQATMAPPSDAENPRIDERAAPRAQRAAFPSRPAAAPTGSEFLRATAQLSAPDRERAILAEFQSGNLPSHIRNLVPISLAYRDHLATVYVMPDYLALGSDEDYVIMPMAPRTAMRIARQFGLMLPTRKLVDDIYQNAALRLTPEPMQPGPLMTSNAYYREHDRRIKSQLPSLNTKTRIHVVQHSQWNEDQTTASDLSYVRANTDYRKIADGNSSGNGTPGLNSKNGDQWNRATSDAQVGPVWTEARAAASRWFGVNWDNENIKAGGMDFSDTVEVMFIFGFAGNSGGVKGFFDQFL